MSLEKKQPSKLRRRWFQLRLRTLLAMVTLASVTIGWVVFELEQRRGEALAIAWAETNDCYFSFSTPLEGPVEFRTFDEGSRTWWECIEDRLFGDSVRSFEFGDFDKVRSNPELTDLSPLTHLKNLKFLKIRRQSQLSDLSPLAGLENLEHLDISGTKVSDLSPLADLENLETLRIEDMLLLSEIPNLAGFKNLKTLQIDGAELLSKISNLAGLNNLETLQIKDTRQLKELGIKISR